MGNKSSAVSKHTINEKVQVYSRDNNKWLDGVITKILKNPPRYEVEYRTDTGGTKKKNVLVENESEVLRKARVKEEKHENTEKWGLASEEMEDRPMYKRGDKVMTKNGLGTVESVSGDGRIWVRIGQKTLKKYKVTDLRKANATEIAAAGEEAVSSATRSQPTQQPKPSQSNYDSRASSASRRPAPLQAPAAPAQVRQSSSVVPPSNRQKSLQQQQAMLAQHGLTARPAWNQANRYTSNASYTRSNMASVNDILPPTTPAKEWGASEVERWAKITFQGSSLAYLLCQFVKDGRTLLDITHGRLKRSGIKNEQDRDDIVYAIGKLKKLQKNKQEKAGSEQGPALNMFQDFGHDEFPDLPDDF